MSVVICINTLKLIKKPAAGENFGDILVRAYPIPPRGWGVLPEVSEIRPLLHLF